MISPEKDSPSVYQEPNACDHGKAEKEEKCSPRLPDKHRGAIELVSSHASTYGTVDAP